MRFNITIEQDEDGRFVDECTDPPRCLSEGDAVEEDIRNINEAVVGCLKSQAEDCQER
ncbi:MAG: type II toxin-antitoxin system HicB family antitoxin [Methanothrix sp.]|nr:type II toxin-antitoxin system HicB family antitoxin [Methanothrix sp.]